jgi:hypothetical protein
MLEDQLSEEEDYGEDDYGNNYFDAGEEGDGDDGEGGGGGQQLVRLNRNVMRLLIADYDDNRRILVEKSKHVLHIIMKLYL